MSVCNFSVYVGKGVYPSIVCRCVSQYVHVNVCAGICVIVHVSVCVCQCAWGMCREVLVHYVLGFTYLISLNAVGQ